MGSAGAGYKNSSKFPPIATLRSGNCKARSIGLSEKDEWHFDCYKEMQGSKGCGAFGRRSLRRSDRRMLEGGNPLWPPIVRCGNTGG